MPPDALALANRYYSAIGAGSLEATTALFSPNFYKKTPRDRLLAGLKALREHCGSATSHSVTATTILDDFTSEKIRANIQFTVTYDRCRSIEQMSIVKDGDAASEIDALAAHIDEVPQALPDLSKRSSTTT